MSSSSELAEYFIKHAPRFHEDLNIENIDNKHIDILNEFYKEVDKGTAFKKNSFRNWKAQSDMDVPAQLSAETFNSDKLAISILKYIYKKIFRRTQDMFLLSSFHDDIDIIKLIDAENLLIENPVHKTPGATSSFRLNGTSVNIRWLRYIYALKRILDFDIINNGGVWVDVGSYYGGLQGLVYKYVSGTKVVMVDFHHQLCRSFIYLSELYPDAQHILPGDLKKYSSLEEIPSKSFVYVPVSEYDYIADQKADLVTNFFSLGEMRREYFNIYLNSRLFKDSKICYLVNRFVSAPFFESTYDTDLSVLDYSSSNRKIQYFDIFPIHHYIILKRKVFDRQSYRNTSSSYFELVTSKISN